MKAVAAVTFANLNHCPARQPRRLSVGRRETTPAPLCHEFAPQNSAAVNPFGTSLAARAQTLLIHPSILVESSLIIEQGNRYGLLRPACRCLAPAGRTHDDSSCRTTIAHHALELFHISKVERSTSVLCINNNSRSRSCVPAMVDQYVYLARGTADCALKNHGRLHNRINASVIRQKNLWVSSGSGSLPSE